MLGIESGSVNGCPRGRRVVDALARAMIGGSLASLLRYGDRNAMRFSIENRVPFLSIKLAEYVLGLPEEYLISRNGETKSVFRAAMRGIIPDAVLDRRDKVGFATPIGDLSKNLAAQIAKRDDLERIDLLAGVIQGNGKAKDMFQNKQSFSPKDWRIINLILWIDQTERN
jgi:asparagine synthase (glutamine-hydrolysing)